VYLDRTICHKGHVGAKGNDVVGVIFIKIKKGLRQGNPLSQYYSTSLLICFFNETGGAAPY
jgi:hypothetical protein